MRLKLPDVSAKSVSKAQERFFSPPPHWLGEWIRRGLKPITARGWHLEAKYTASDFMICVSHFPLEWNEKEFKDLIKDFGETEKCFLVRKSFELVHFFNSKNVKNTPRVLKMASYKSTPEQVSQEDELGRGPSQDDSSRPTESWLGCKPSKKAIFGKFRLYWTECFLKWLILNFQWFSEILGQKIFFLRVHIP